MSVRSIAAAALLGLGSLSPAFAEPAAPGHLLAGKDAAQRLAKVEHGFALRTARVGSIMAPEPGAAPLRIPVKPSWTRPVRREAAAIVN